MLTGRCLCGQVAYEIDGEIGPIDFCHCSYCRRASGSAFASNASILKASFTLLPRTQRALPGGTHASSPEGVAHLPTSLLTGNRLDSPGAHFIPPALRFRHPQLVDATERVRIQALDQQVRDPRARLARQFQGLFD